MKRILMVIGLGCFLSAPSLLMAQNHGEVGIFGEYMRFAPYSSTTNFVGLGGRVGLNVRPSLALEAEMSYDFARNYTRVVSNGGTTTFTRTKVRPLTGLFGPKLQIGTGALRAFLTGKVGFIDFSNSQTTVASPGTFTGAVEGVGGSGTHFAAYPGGGIEAYAGPIGIRAEIGDDIYLNNGTYNNMKVTFGPSLRF